MNTAGIIAEYNPFHNGHAYQLAKVRRQTQADFIVIAMSGDFLQRGAPAILDKHSRARAALLSGADLVLELPVPFATGSAEYFAKGGVALLAATGIVHTLCYGVECENPALLAQLASTMAEPSPSFDKTIAGLAAQGMTFPAARQEALASALPQYEREELISFCSSPNNLLAAEYEKALILQGNPMRGLGIPRVGDGFHDTEVHSACASATAIRKLLLAPEPSEARLSSLLPKTGLSLLRDAKTQGLLLDTDDFSAALYAKLLAECGEGFCAYADCSPALSKRIQRLLPEFVSFTQFAGLLKTKELTRTRVNRVLLHILLDIRQTDRDAPVSYLRVLGFSRRAAPLLSEISKKASVPLLTKVADASRILSNTAMDALKKDLYAADLYRGMSRIKSGLPLSNEYNTPITIP